MSKPSEPPLSIALGNQDGFVAPRYKSGQRSADALLEAGRALLTHVSYEGLSVSELCKHANLTTGAFYRRFEGKEAYFLALQRLALDDGMRTQRALTTHLDSEHGARIGLQDACVRVVDGVRQWHLHHRGILRASMQRRDHTSGGWQPFKELGREFIRDISQRLIRTPELCQRTDASRRLAVGFQIVIGTMINASLNDPGPIRLEDTMMTDALAQTLALYAQAFALRPEPADSD
ncbi:TetR/AcrR family transcriptional regulator [Pararobbsia silviterrae]|uniref:TetR/AcrR family transcriptional regulator n=1 Tax=Pararobbsia silviterrae TaxID=1792498 RepID=A0A494Y3K9_9BURK|nr:TetR/AcrR family transcriptional regulator [Pararobbsia silviterrae]RKP56598.1 TetR/AcrR family transcriptional regulator [Pararobbsia silviterrae]